MTQHGMSAAGCHEGRARSPSGIPTCPNTPHPGQQPQSDPTATSSPAGAGRAGSRTDTMAGSRTDCAWGQHCGGTPWLGIMAAAASAHCLGAGEAAAPARACAATAGRGTGRAPIASDMDAYQAGASVARPLPHLLDTTGAGLLGPGLRLHTLGAPGAPSPCKPLSTAMSIHAPPPPRPAAATSHPTQPP